MVEPHPEMTSDETYQWAASRDRGDDDIPTIRKLIQLSMDGLTGYESVLRIAQEDGDDV